MTILPADDEKALFLGSGWIAALALPLFFVNANPFGVLIASLVLARVTVFLAKRR